MTADENILKILDVEPQAAQDDAPEYRLQEQIGFLLRKAQQRHVAIFAAHIPEVTPPQFAALAKLGEVDETSQNQLGALVAMDAATIKGVIDRMRARGLVTVSKDEADKRRLMVSLTPEGRTALAGFLANAKKVTGETLSPLNAREAQQLARLLARIG
ncbi:MarR family winged helix-turn-helix transcriptional regulator [Arvimicrobium flavum]|uniref:MarR family winged helix-turn-helix transcriptional regulator n=1 Tax=Arvimicrobium flavum TaxID=3393320 RepID=UPI00237A2B24|nr:MarR family transcriptional regulator [Mesorhizobium shangrilense]